MVVEHTFKIQNKLGMHARPSASFVKLANKFSSNINVMCDGEHADGKSIMGLMLLGAGEGSNVKITADGIDAETAIDKLGKLIESKFNEE